MSSLRCERVIAWLLGSCLALQGCRSASREPTPAGREPAAAAGQATPAPLPELRPGPSSRKTWQSSDWLWLRAQQRPSPGTLEQLANREGAAGLMEAVQAGGDLAHTGLLALPYAGDGELALGQLCDWTTRANGVGRSWLLRAVHDIAAAGPAFGERLDASGWARCQATLGKLAAGGGELPPSERDLAASASALIGAAR